MSQSRIRKRSVGDYAGKSHPMADFSCVSSQSADSKPSSKSDDSSSESSSEGAKLEDVPEKDVSQSLKQAENVAVPRAAMASQAEGSDDLVKGEPSPIKKKGEQKEEQEEEGEKLEDIEADPKKVQESLKQSEVSAREVAKSHQQLMLHAPLCRKRLCPKRPWTTSASSRARDDNRINA